MSDNGRKEVTPMPKITDEQYRYLSRAVYFVGKFPYQYRKGRMVTIHGRKYVVEDVESNEKNGLQALAVTPKDDPDELVIAYGGTDPADIRDALTDIEFIALGREHRPLEDGRDRLREVIAENPRVQELISSLGLDGTALLAARGSGDSQAVSALPADARSRRPDTPSERLLPSTLPSSYGCPPPASTDRTSAPSCPQKNAPASEATPTSSETTTTPATSSATSLPTVSNAQSPPRDSAQPLTFSPVTA